MKIKMLFVFLLLSSCALINSKDGCTLDREVGFLYHGYINDYPCTYGGYILNENQCVVEKSCHCDYESEFFWGIEDSFAVYSKNDDESLQNFSCYFTDGKKHIRLSGIEDEIAIGSASFSKHHNILALTKSNRNEKSKENDSILIYDLKDLIDGKNIVKKFFCEDCAELRIVGDRIYYSKYHNVESECLANYGLFYRDIDDMDKEICLNENFYVCAISEDGNYVMGRFYAKEDHTYETHIPVPLSIWNLKTKKVAIIEENGFRPLNVYSKRKKGFYMRDDNGNLKIVGIEQDYN